jgi:dipeptidyl aminopeptidase
MSSQAKYHDEETEPLTAAASRDAPRKSTDSLTSVSTTSVVFEQLGGEAAAGSGDADGTGRAATDGGALSKADFDIEDTAYTPPSKSSRKRRRRLCWIVCAAVVGAWLIALAVFLLQPRGVLRRASAGGSRGGKRITLNQVLGGAFRERRHAISWIDGANGEDGLLLERNGGSGNGYLVVKDVRSRSKDREQEADMHDSRVLMNHDWFTAAGVRVYPEDVWPSRDLNKVLCISNKESVSLLRPTPSRCSFTQEKRC